MAETPLNFPWRVHLTPSMAPGDLRLLSCVSTVHQQGAFHEAGLPTPAPLPQCGLGMKSLPLLPLALSPLPSQQ